MTRSYTVIFNENDLAPDFLEHLAALHHMSPELYARRCIRDALTHMYPVDAPHRDAETLEEFFIENGFSKPVKAGWQNMVIMTEPGNNLLQQLRDLALSQQCQPVELALQFIREGIARQQGSHLSTSE